MWSIKAQQCGRVHCFAATTLVHRQFVAAPHTSIVVHYPHHTGTPTVRLSSTHIASLPGQNIYHACVSTLAAVIFNQLAVGNYQYKLFKSDSSASSVSMMLLLGSASLLLLLFCSPTPGTASGDGGEDPNKLLVLLVDGFRWDYFDSFQDDELPGFKRLRENGVKADYLQPTFPSYSFVNFYSLMTGGLPRLQLARSLSRDHFLVTRIILMFVSLMLNVIKNKSLSSDLGCY